MNEDGAVVRAVKKIEIHRDWNYLTESWDADLAILVLMKSVEFASYIQPICLPADENVEDYDQGTVVREC